MKTRERTRLEIRTSSPAHSGTQDIEKGRGDPHDQLTHKKKPKNEPGLCLKTVDILSALKDGAFYTYFLRETLASL